MKKSSVARHRCLRGIAGRTRRQSQHGLLGFSFVGLRAIHLGFVGFQIRATCSYPVPSSWRKRLLAPGQQHSTWYPIRITLVNGRDFDKMQVNPCPSDTRSTRMNLSVEQDTDISTGNKPWSLNQMRRQEPYKCGTTVTPRHDATLEWPRNTQPAVRGSWTNLDGFDLGQNT